MTYLAVPDILDAQCGPKPPAAKSSGRPSGCTGVGKLSVVTDPTGAIIGLIEPEGNALPVSSPVH